MAVKKGSPHAARRGRQGFNVDIKLDGSPTNLPLEYSKSEYIDYDAGTVKIPSNLSRKRNGRLRQLFDDVPIALGEEDWETLQLEFSATIHPDMSKLIPEAERRAAGIKGVSEISVSLRCPATSVRKVVRLTDDGGTGDYSGTCELSRGDVKGYIEAKAKLTRTTDAPVGTAYSLARRRRAILADSPKVKIYLDKDLGSELIKYVFVNFETYQDGKLREWKSQLYWLDLSNPEQVVCYINNQSKEWKPVIETEYGKTTRGGRIREYMGRSLVAQVLNSVYPHAFLQNVDSEWNSIKDGDSWYRYALEALAKEMTKGSPEDQAAWIDTHLQSLQGAEPDSSELFKEIGLLVQKQMKTRPSGEKLARSLVDFAN